MTRKLKELGNEVSSSPRHLRLNTGKKRSPSRLQRELAADPRWKALYLDKENHEKIYKDIQLNAGSYQPALLQRQT